MTRANIVDAMREGASMHCTEGANYCVWIVHKGKRTNIRRDTAKSICDEYTEDLDFDGFKGHGIRFKAVLPTLTP